MTCIKNENDKYFRLFAENSVVGIIVLSPELKFLFANDFFCNMIGYDFKELQNKTLIELTHFEDKEKCNKEFIALKNNKKDAFQIEKRHITITGKIIWSEMSISAYRNAQGEIELYTGTINNISQRKKIEQQESESRKLFTTLFKDSPIAIVLGSVENHEYIDVNDTFIRYMGYSREEIIGKKSTEISLFENDSDREAMINIVKKKGYINGYQINCKTKIGQILTVLFSISIVKVNGSDCLILTAMDISGRIATENALKESETNYKSLINFLPDGIIVHQNKQIVMANNIAIKLLEAKSEIDILNRSVIDIVHPKYRIHTIERIHQTETSKEGTPLLEEEFITLTGKTIYVEVASLPFKYKGKVAHLVVFRDISDRKRSEFELIRAKNKAEESDKLKSAFLANMSHEIRTPMNAIKGFAQLLEDPDLTSEKKGQFIKIINQRTDDLLMLINDILDTAKIEAGQMSISETTEDIGLLFNEIYQFFITQENLFKEKSIALNIDNQLKGIQNIFTADFFRLRQILINLLNNAIKFTDSGSVEFGCKMMEDELNLLFYVKDTGIGIPEDKKHLVFAPFRQLNDMHITRQHSGTGLGLSIVSGLLRLMDGKIWFESAVDVGSTFYFSIPFKHSNGRIINNSTETKKFFDWRNKTIFIVEDDIFNAQLIIEYLVKTNAKVLHAKNGLEAISLFKQNPGIDLTLMDIQLPDINGFDLTKMFKTMVSSTKIIAQTAYAAESDKKRALASGCVDYISKPIVQEQLLKIIKKNIG